MGDIFAIKFSPTTQIKKERVLSDIFAIKKKVASEFQSDAAEECDIIR